MPPVYMLSRRQPPVLQQESEGMSAPCCRNHGLFWQATIALNGASSSATTTEFRRRSMTAAAGGIRAFSSLPTSLSVPTTSMPVRRVVPSKTMDDANSTAATTTTVPKPAFVQLNAVRSRAEIQKLVARRVAERNAWKINGIPAHDLPRPSLLDRWKFFKTMPKLFLRQTSDQAELDQHYPVRPIDWAQLQHPPVASDGNGEKGRMQITWFGHSTLLVQMNSVNILTDPIWSERCSPLPNWFGPQRYQAPPCRLDELLKHVPIDLVLISHNHYDHLDYATVKAIQEYRQSSTSSSSPVQFVVPLGLGKWFRSHISSSVQLFEQDWGESMEFHSVRNNQAESDTTNTTAGSPLLTVMSVPMRHWTMRTIDHDQTLWCGYSVTDARSGRKFLFPGDTAWFDRLHDFSTLYGGPWDVAAIPIGAYEPRTFMKVHHINVAEAVRMKSAVQAQAAIPIHWGTYPLTSEPVLEPPTKLLEAMKDRPDADTFVPWNIGETRQF